MSPPSPSVATSELGNRALVRVAMDIAARLREERIRRHWTVRQLADRARLSVAVVYAVESGRPASLSTYIRMCAALDTTLRVVSSNERRRPAPSVSEVDFVHAAMGELEAAHLSARGHTVGIDEPFQHYQFAGRADVVAWSVHSRALLHIENRTRFPNLQEAAGAWNAKRAYLEGALAERIGVRAWLTVTHVMVGLWSAEVMHTVRLRTATFHALCPDPMDEFVAWWSESPPARRRASTFVMLDPAASGRQRRYCSLDDALKLRPRHRGYAEAAAALRRNGVSLR